MNQPKLTVVPDVQTETRKLMLVTPELAKQWLDLSIGNRSIANQTVRKYAETMNMNRWRPIKSEPIVFSKTGKLMNAHHRLRAVIQHGKPVLFWVEFDEDEDNMLYLDDCRARRPADNKFIVTGDENVHFRERLAKVILAYFRSARANQFSIASLDICEEAIREDFDTLTKKVPGIKNKVAAPYLAALTYCLPLSKDKVLEFATALSTRSGVKGTPAGAVLSLMASGKNTSTTADRVRTFAAVVGAIEQHLLGRKLEIAKRNDGAVERISSARELKGLWRGSLT